MTCGDADHEELLIRAGLEIVEDRGRGNAVAPPSLVWSTITTAQAGPTVTVSGDDPDPYAAFDTQWHRLAEEYGILGEDGVFLIHADWNWTCCAPEDWTPVRLGRHWQLAAVLGDRPEQLAFVTASPDGEALLAATTGQHELRLAALDHLGERRTAAADRAAVQETPEEARAAWATMFDGPRPAKAPVKEWGNGLALNMSAPDDVLLALLGHTYSLALRELPDAVVDAMLRHPDRQVRKLLLDHGHRLTGEQWSQLMLGEEDPRHRSVAVGICGDNSGELPEATYEQIATDPSTRVRGAAAYLRGLPTHLRRALAADQEASVRRAVVWAWPQLDEPTRRKLIVDPDDEVRTRALLCHHSEGTLTRSVYETTELDPSILGSCHLEPALATHLAHHGDREERRALAGNPHLPLELLLHLGRDTDERVRFTVAERPELTEEQRAAIPMEIPPSVHYGTLGWVRKLHDDPDAMRRLAASSHLLVRRSVARAEHLPPDVVERLARDEDRVVRLFLAESCDDAPPDMLMEVYGWWDGTMSKPGRPRNHPNFPRRGLLRFADDPDPRMRLLALDDPDSTVDLVERFTRDPHDKVRYRAAEDHRLPLASAIRLLDDPSGSVRAAAARHPELPVRVLIRLLWDPDTAADAARRTPLPTDVMRQLVRHITG